LSPCYRLDNCEILIQLLAQDISTASLKENDSSQKNIKAGIIARAGCP
jgi:hypothetical protein